MQPLSLGRWSWLWFVATSLVLDSRIQAELSRESWVSEWAVLLCPLRTRVVQSFANNCEDKDCDSPDVTCVIEPSPCRNPLPVQVEEMEVWSLLQSQRTDLGSLLDRHPYRVVEKGASEGGLQEDT